MGVELLDSDTIETGHHVRMQLVGDLDKRRLARPFACLAHQSPILARLVEQ